MPNPIEAITAQDAVAVTPSDSTTYNPVLDALIVGVGGDVKIDTARGTTVTLTVLDGALIPIACKKVYTTDTTASGIVGLKY